MKSNILSLAAFAVFLAANAVSSAAQETQQAPEAGGYTSPGMMGWGHPGMMGWGHPGMMGRGGMGHPGMMAIMLVMMDTNNDGGVSLEELQAVHARIFTFMDANKDGKLTPQEVQGVLPRGN